MGIQITGFQIGRPQDVFPGLPGAFGMAGTLGDISAVGGQAMSPFDPTTGLPTRAATTFQEAGQFAFRQNQFVNRLAQRARAQSEATIQQALGLVGRGGPGSLAALTSPLFTQLANIRGQVTFQPFDFTAGIPRPAPFIGGFDGGRGGGRDARRQPSPVGRPDRFISLAEQADPFGLNAGLQQQRTSLLQQQAFAGQAQAFDLFGGGGDVGGFDQFLGGGFDAFQQPQPSEFEQAFIGGGDIFAGEFGQAQDQFFQPQPGEFESQFVGGQFDPFAGEFAQPDQFAFEASDPQFAQQGLNPGFEDLVTQQVGADQFAAEQDFFDVDLF